MGVQLNIKDPETVRLAKELAERNGTSVTEAIRTALESAWAEREADMARHAAGIRELAAEFHRNIPPEWRDKTSKEVLGAIYNDDGSFAG